MCLRFYLVESLGAARNHHFLFAQWNDKQKGGRKFHVMGDIQRGMIYECLDIEPPEESVEYISMLQLGLVSSSDLDRIEDICRSNPPPEKQFNGPRRIDPGKPLRRCQEWAAETVRQLREEGVLS